MCFGVQGHCRGVGTYARYYSRFLCSYVLPGGGQCMFYITKKLLCVGLFVWGLEVNVWGWAVEGRGESSWRVLL